ncbi:MAG TPA: SH3 domain-containing protein [Chloroflexota bacterium]|nr:SH3 domain-containing protein [Chloroflexota bacterium]
MRKAKPTGAPQPTAPLGSRSRARLALAVHAAAARAERGREGRRTLLLAVWLAACALLVGALLTAAPIARPVALDPPAGAIQRAGPAEDDEPPADAPAVLAARQVALGPAEEDASAADVPSGGLYLASGGPPQPLRAAPDRTAEVLVQVPNDATLDDLGEETPDGAWRHVAWDGWDGWIAAGLLLRRP